MAFNMNNPPPMGVSSFPNRTFSNLKAFNSQIVISKTITQVTLSSDSVAGIPQETTINTGSGILVLGNEDGQNFVLPANNYVIFKLNNSFIKSDSVIQLSLVGYDEYASSTLSTNTALGACPVLGLSKTEDGYMDILIMNNSTTGIDGVIKISYLIT